MSFNTGFGAAGQAAAALDSVRWGSDYLLKVHQAVPGTNDSLLVTRVSERRGRGSTHSARAASLAPLRVSLQPAPSHLFAFQAPPAQPYNHAIFNPCLEKPPRNHPPFPPPAPPLRWAT